LPASRGYDPVLAAALAALVTLGVVMVYSAGFFQGALLGDGAFYLKRQLAWVGLGAVALCACALIDYRAWSRFIYPILGLSFLSLALLYVPGLGAKVNGAVRWYRLGPGNLQPSELAKLALVLYLASSVARKGERIRSFSVGFLPAAVISGLFVALIIRQPDLGTSVVLSVITLGMLLVAGARVSFLLFAAVAAAPLVYHQLFDYKFRADRIMAFLDPWAHQKDSGYQLVQSMKAFGVGGLFGSGFGESRLKLGFLPEAHTDFIVPVIGEELGFVGVAILIGLFGVLVWRGYRVAFRCPDRYGALLAFGITTWFACQALINLGVVTGLLPTKGLTLPFVSYGGSSMIACMAAAGVLLNVSAMDPPPERASRERPPPPKRPARPAPASG
jgi:cell division protein FtsW